MSIILISSNYFILGPYQVKDLNTNKGTCKLQSLKTGQLLKRTVPLKQLKQYSNGEDKTTDKETKSAADKVEQAQLNTDHSNNTQFTQLMSESQSIHISDDDNDTQKVSTPDNTIDDSTSDDSFICDLHDSQETDPVPTEVLQLSQLNEEQIKKQMYVIEKQLKGIYSGHVKNWRKEILESGHCAEYPNLTKMDIAFNAHFGPFADNQIDIIIDIIREFFPEADINMSTKYYFQKLVH